MPMYYRVVLMCGYLLFGALAVYKGYKVVGLNWLLIVFPFAVVVGVFIVRLVIQVFPPRLQAHAEGDIWLKLK